MAEEYDRKVIPEFLQTAFSIWLGASYKSLDLIKDPMGCADKAVKEAKELVTIPDDAGEGIQEKAQALAAVWMEKGATLMQECQSAGEQFTSPK